MTAALSSIANLRTSANSQQYQQLTREAAESGVEHAKRCLEQQITWTGLLRPEGGESCVGSATQCTNADSCYVLKDGGLTTTYEVTASTSDGGLTYFINAKGLVRLQRETTGEVWQERSTDLKVRVGKDVSLKQVVFGYSMYGSGGAYFFILKNNPAVPLEAVGYNSDGQLATGNFKSVLTPSPAFVGRNPRAVYTNFVSMGFASFIIDNNGRVYGSGRNEFGQLGNGSPGAAYTRIANAVEFKIPVSVQAVLVETNGYATYVLASDNKIYAAGQCWAGQLGTGVSADASMMPWEDDCLPRPTPAPVVLPPVDLANDNTIPISISADAEIRVAAMKGGAAYAWGNDELGALGNGVYKNTAKPRRVKKGAASSTAYFGSPGQPKVIKAITDGYASYFLTDDGDIWGAGGNDTGQLGNNSPDSSSRKSGMATVRMIRPPSGSKYVDVQSDQGSVQMLTEDGEVWGAGINTYGQLGNDTSADVVRTPRKFKISTKAVAVYTSAVYDEAFTSVPEKHMANTFVIDENGDVWGAGSNHHGQLGVGTTISHPNSQKTPVKMQNVSAATEVMSGYGTTVVVAGGGKVYTVGNNANGQLGDGTTVSKSMPFAHKYTNTATPMYY